MLKKHLSSEELTPHLEALKKLTSSNNNTSLLDALENIEHPTPTIANLAKEAITLAGWKERPPSTNALPTIFSQIELEQTAPNSQFYPLNKLNVQSMMERQTEPIHNSAEFKKHLISYTREATELLKTTELISDSLVIRLNDLIRKWYWCIPNSQNGESIADVSRLASSITSCLIQQPDLKQFGMVVGDVSGIQRYIFEIAVANQKKVGQRLRARSLFFTVLSEVISHKIADQFKVHVWNVIIAAGGKFYILLPWSEQAHQHLQEIQKQMDTWSLQKYNGEVVLNLGWHTIEKQNIRAGDETLTLLNESLLDRKARPLSSCLFEETEWDESVWMIPDPLHTRCTSCSKFPAYAEELCTFCYHDAHVGQKLQNTKWISFHHSNQGDISFFENYSANLHDRFPTQSKDAYLIWSLEECEQSHITSDLPILTHPLANYVPKTNDGTTKDFDTLAESGDGVHQLGYFKADVDQLGTIMTFGLKRDEQSVSWGTISNLSTMIDMFFSSWLPDRLRNKYPLTYTVFAGGDDLFLIGPWEEIMHLSLDIEDHFRKFTGHHPEITLSASLTFGTARTPIHFQSEIAERDLEKAKDHPAVGNIASRNQVCFLGVPLSWSKLHDLFQETQQVRIWWAQRRISSSLLHRLVTFANDYLEYREGDISKVTFVPNLVYTINRNVQKKDEEVRVWLARFVDHRYLDPDTINPLLYMGQIVRLILMYKTPEKEEAKL